MTTVQDSALALVPVLFQNSTSQEGGESDVFIHPTESSTEQSNISNLMIAATLDNMDSTAPASQNRNELKSGNILKSIHWNG